jgi:hypothetical protein
VIGAEVVARGAGYVYRLGEQQLNVHGPGVSPDPVARDPVRPGNSDLCFRWNGPISDAVAHLSRCGVEVELGPVERQRRPRFWCQRVLPRSGWVADGVHRLLGIGE